MIDMEVPEGYVTQSEAMKVLEIPYYELQRLKKHGRLVYSSGIPPYISKASIERELNSRPKKPERF